MTILELIKAQCRTSGVPEKYAEKIQSVFKIEKEEGIGGFVSLFKDNLLPDLQAGEASAKKAKEDAIAAYEKEHGLKGGKPIENPNPNSTPQPGGLSPEIQALIEAQNKQMQEMKELLTASQKKAETAERTVKAKALVTEAKLPESWASRLNFDSETPLEEQIKTLTEEYTQIQQDVINQAVARGDYAPGAVNLPERSEADWAKFMNGETGEGEKAVGVASLGV